MPVAKRVDERELADEKQANATVCACATMHREEQVKTRLKYRLPKL